MVFPRLISFRVVGYSISHLRRKGNPTRLSFIESSHRTDVLNFMANDTHANIFLNLLIREYGCLSDEYRIVGFDDSPIASEAIIPVTTIGQQIDKIAYETMKLLVSQMNERQICYCFAQFSILLLASSLVNFITLLVIIHKFKERAITPLCYILSLCC